MDIEAETLSRLKKTEPKKQLQKPDQTKPLTGQQNSRPNIGNRRMSVAGTSLFSVNQRVVENAVDFLEKVPRENAIIKNNPNPKVQKSSLVNIVSEKECGVSGVSNEAVFSSNYENGEIVTSCIVDDVTSIVNFSENSDSANEGTELQTTKSVPALLPLSKSIENKNVEVVPVKVTQGPSVFNNFCPFRRLANVPFALGGRPRRNRSKSVDYYASIPPPLETLFETEEEHAKDGLSEENGAVHVIKNEIVGDSNVQEPMVDAVFAQTQQTLNVVSKWIRRFDI